MQVVQNLKLNQTLNLVPQLRQGIEILALSTQDIDEIIYQELQDNPMLEYDDYFGSNNYQKFAKSSYEIALETKILEVSFRDYLLNQINLEKFNNLEKSIGVYLINNLDDRGILANKLEIYQQIKLDLGVFYEWAELVRKKIMNLDPVGCGATSLEEALYFRVEKYYPQYKTEFSKYFRNKNYKISNFMRRVFSRINLHPASGYSENVNNTIFAIPDVLVEITGNKYEIKLSKSHSKYLRISSVNKKIFRDHVKLNNYLKKAKLLCKNIEFREENLLKICKLIIEYQAGWFTQNKFLRPLNMYDIAQQVGLHESSVSRLVNNKYLLSPRGLFKLKYFFSANNTSNKFSSDLVKSLIVKIINLEEKSRPLYDNNILEILKKQNINLSRRVIAKYRNSLNIPRAALRAKY